MGILSHLLRIGLFSLSVLGLLGCTLEASLKDLAGSSPDNSITINLTTPYASPANMSAYPATGTCKNEGAPIEVIKSTSVLGTTTCSGGTWSVNLDLSSEADGVLNLTARMPNSSGTVVTTSPVDVLKDTTGPDVTGLGPLADGAYGNSLTSSTTLTWNAATDSGSGFDHYEIAIGTTAGAADISNWTTVANVNSTQRTALTLVEGSTYYPSIRAADKAGNTSTVVSGDGWIVDTTAPSLPLSFKDMNFGSILESPLMTWNAATDAVAGISGYQVALGTTPGATDVLNWQSLGSNLLGNVTGLSLTNGQIYYPSLRAIDNAGNISTAAQDNGFRAVDKWKNQEPTLPSYLSAATNAASLQPDNKRILGGNFTTIGGEALIRAGRLNSDGTSDASFNIGTGFDGSVDTIAIQSDGKILVGGWFTSYKGTAQNYISRLNSDGSIDTSFNTGVGFNNGVETINIQTDGKILVAGQFTSYNGTAQNYITRLNSDGTRDTSFNIGTGFNIIVLTLAIQSDGKILVGGAFISYNGTTQNYITRLNSDGTRDTSFNIGTGFNGGVTSFAVQSDGKIVVGGQFSSYNGTTQNRITRLNSDGTRDTTFTIGTGFDGSVTTFAIQADGKILVGGQFTSYSGIAQNFITRLNSDGTRDTSFNIGTGFNGRVSNFAIQSDGKILSNGSFNGYDSLLTGPSVLLGW